MTGAVIRRARGAGRDVVPDAVDWANIVSIGTSGVNADQTISGISQQITLQFDVSISAGAGTTFYSKNGGADTAFVNGGTLAMVNGDTLHFRATRSGANFIGTVTVKNQSDIGTPTLDTFTFSVDPI